MRRMYHVLGGVVQEEQEGGAVVGVGGNRVW